MSLTWLPGGVLVSEKLETDVGNGYYRPMAMPIFDADNHLYETIDALTKHMPDRYKRVIDYVEVKGRTKIVVNGKISEYIPNPTFEVVARPGAQEDYYRHGNPE